MIKRKQDGITSMEMFLDILRTSLYFLLFLVLALRYWHLLSSFLCLHWLVFSIHTTGEPSILPLWLYMLLHLELQEGTTNYEMEKIMMVDVLLWAMDTPPPADIIFIVWNVDFCYVFQKLRQRSYNVFLVCQSMSEMLPGMLGGVNKSVGSVGLIISPTQFWRINVIKSFRPEH